MNKPLIKGMPNGFMFDTNVFNHILDKETYINKFLEKKFDYYITHLQQDELNNTRNSERKEELIKVFDNLPNEVITTETCLMDISKMNMPKMGNGKLQRKIVLEL